MRVAVILGHPETAHFLKSGDNKGDNNTRGCALNSHLARTASIPILPSWDWFGG